MWEGHAERCTRFLYRQGAMCNPIPRTTKGLAILCLCAGVAAIVVGVLQIHGWSEVTRKESVGVCVLAAGALGTASGLIITCFGNSQLALTCAAALSTAVAVMYVISIVRMAMSLAAVHTDPDNPVGYLIATSAVLATIEGIIAIYQMIFSYRAYTRCTSDELDEESKLVYHPEHA